MRGKVVVMGTWRRTEVVEGMAKKDLTERMERRKLAEEASLRK